MVPQHTRSLLLPKGYDNGRIIMGSSGITISYAVSEKAQTQGNFLVFSCTYVQLCILIQRLIDTWFCGSPSVLNGSRNQVAEIGFVPVSSLAQ